jgi:Kef-type K+ transport system membrane component KefB/nucleotide-binding universal stress UspA family protein
MRPQTIAIAAVLGIAAFLCYSPAVMAAAGASLAPSEALFIAQIIILLIVGRSLGEVMQRLGQPAIMGQLLAGIVLGPSLLGFVLPDLQHAMFPSDPRQKIMIDAVSQIGILLLLLLTGMETDLALIAPVRRAAASISVAGIVAPFACGVLLGELIPASMLPNPDLRLITSLFLGTALSISSVKIVAAVVEEMNFMRRTIGQLIVASAVIDDTIGWIIIAVIFGIALRGEVEIVSVVATILGTVAFMAASLTVGQRIVSAIIRWTNDNFVSELPVITAIIVITGVMALITHMIGVHTVLGAFVAGILVGRSPILTQHVRDQLRGTIIALFMPVFFGIAGLGADLTVLKDPSLLLVAVGLIAIASIGKFGGAFLGGSLARLSARESLAIGCGMNARGSTEVIVATIGLSMGALNQTLYSMIVLMAFVTTMAMPPLLRWALARLPVSNEEADRLAREAVEAKGFLGTLERLLLAVDDTPNGRFVARLGGILSAWRRIPTTVVDLTVRPDAEAASPATVVKEAAATTTADGDKEPAPADVTIRRHDAAQDDAVTKEARKGYGLLMIGVDEVTVDGGGFGARVTKLAEEFDGPVLLVEARGANHQDPVGSGLDILVPVTGTQDSRRALEVAIALARAGTSSLTLIHVTVQNPSRRRRVAEQLRRPDHDVMRDAVALAEHYQIECRTVMRQDVSAAEAILKQLKRGRHDLVVLGVRPRAGGGMFFGAVADDLMLQAPASVVLVSA